MSSNENEFITLMPFRDVVDFEIEEIFISNKRRIKQLMNDHKIFDHIKEHRLSKLLDLDTYSSCDYYDEAKFNQNMKNSDTHFNIFSMNIRSLPLHGSELNIFLSMLKVKFEIIVLTEIGAKNISTVENLFPDYWFVHVIPEKSTKGGIGIYITKQISQEDFEIMDDFQLDKICECEQCTFESLAIYLKHFNIEYLLIAIYRHPNGKVLHFNESLNAVLNKCSSRFVTVVAGDTNIDIMNYNEKFVSEFLNTMLGSKFLPYITLPTRITHHSATCIDHIFIRLPNKKMQWTITSGLFYCAISDHLPSFSLIKTNSLKTRNRPLIRLYGEKNCTNFCDKMTNFDWNEIYRSSDDWYGDFIKHIKTIFDASFPLVKLSRKRSHDKPWVTTALKNSIAHNHRLYKKSLTSENPLHDEQYKTYNSILRKCLRKSECQYYKRLFEDKKNASINTWKALGPIINPSKSKRNVGIRKIKQDGRYITDNEHISQIFNEYFCNVGRKLGDKIPNRNMDFAHYLPQPIENSFYLSPVCKQDVLKEIKRLNPRKSAGPDNIGNKILQLCPDIFSQNLTVIFNHYIDKGEYPQALKIAKVIPIYKKGERSITSNYRPISLLSVFDKIFEKLVCHKLLNFFEKNKIFYDFQFGFRKLHSTTLALIELTDHIRKRIDEGHIVLSFFVDFTKAFDTVDHNILLYKLGHYGIRGHAQKFMKSYLTNRFQYTYVNGHQSTLDEIKCGVPQGSVLGPILFLIYINDLHFSMNECLTRLFADDTCLCIHDADPKILKQKATLNFQLFAEWCKCNKLTINYDKTNFILFHAKNKKIPLYFDKIESNEHVIKRVSTTRYLGIFIDEKLNWQEHISYIHKSLLIYYGIFNRIKFFVNKDVVRQLYFAFVFSRIKYGIEVYGSCSQEQLLRIQVVQSGLLKLLLKVDRRTNTDYLHRYVRLLKVCDIYKQQLLCFVTNVIHKRVPENFHNYFTYRTTAHNIRNQGLVIEFGRTNYGYLTVRNVGARLWNSLSRDIIEKLSQLNFRKHISSYYIDTYNET